MEVFSFIFGSVIGSFLNVLILRLPKNKSVIFPRSTCPKCKTLISWYQNIPLLSYISLKGKCASCNKKISFQYFLVELISALITLVLFKTMGLNIEMIFSLIVFYVLIVLSFIDLKYKAVPDYLLLMLLFISFFATQFDLIEALKNAFIFSGAFVLLNFILSFYIQNIKAKILKDETLKEQEALGEGDIPVLAAMAIILGLEAALIAIFLAAFFAIIPSVYSQFIKKDIQTPFIPYLALGFTVEYFFHIENFLRVFN